MMRPKINSFRSPLFPLLETKDPEIAQWMKLEWERQELGLEMIASENYVSPEILEAQGSILTNKYAEGYPSKRYYGGCQYVDEIEQLAIDRVKKLFKVEYANVQPHSGSQANMAAYFSLLNPKTDSILGMKLDHGGHLTHGSHVSFSGSVLKSFEYGLDLKTELLDYNQIMDLAKKWKPQLIVAGHSAYPRILDFAKFQDIAQSVGAQLLVDMAHFSGLVAGGVHPSPVEYADCITSTTHKTLRGPRGGFILCSDKERAKKINSSVFPGIQGGPLEHIIAAKAVCFREALQPEFQTYAQQVVTNAKILAKTLLEEDLLLITGGTDNHLLVINLCPLHITGKEAEQLLERAGITANKNTIPNEKKSPFVTSGLRLGTPALTSRGMKEKEMTLIGQWIASLLKNPKDESQITKTRNEIKQLCKELPIDKEFRLHGGRLKG